MSPNKLLEFINKDMRMSADYQPRIILCLLKKPTHVEYKSIVAVKVMPHLSAIAALQNCNKMPFKVLRSHEVVSYDNIHIRLEIWPRPTKEEINQIKRACTRRITAFQLRKEQKST